MSRKKNRKHSIIDGLESGLKEDVEQMLLTGATYSQIVEYLKEKGVGISVASVCRYAQHFNANVEMLNIAGENFRRMMTEMEKYPDLDTSEAIIRLASQNVLNALASADEEEWKSVSVDKMLRESTSLIRATAYKKQIELKNQESYETGIEAVKTLVFEAMAKEKPELYAEVTKFLNAKKGEIRGE